MFRGRSTGKGRVYLVEIQYDYVHYRHYIYRNDAVKGWKNAHSVLVETKFIPRNELRSDKSLFYNSLSHLSQQTFL